jgi:hypothetical protein
LTEPIAAVAEDTSVLLPAAGVAIPRRGEAFRLASHSPSQENLVGHVPGEYDDALIDRQRLNLPHPVVIQKPIYAGSDPIFQ